LELPSGAATKPSALTSNAIRKAAVATLAQINLQQSKIDKAAEMFEKQVQLAKPELNNALTYKYATEAQIE